MLTSFILNPIAILISLSTATSVLLHDTHIDKAAVSALSLPVNVTSPDTNNSKLSSNLSNDFHTHTERNSLSQVVRDLKTPSPRLHPRSSEDRRHLMQKVVTRGHHAFDNYNLPLV